MKFALILVLALVATGCPKDGPPPSGPDNSGGGGGEVEVDERQACTADVECSVVDIECCDVCNGGAVVVVHSDHAADVITTYTPLGSCEGTACTKMACERPTAVCDEGSCALVREDGSIEHAPLPPI